MMIDKREDLLVCRRNELAPENPPALKCGIEGLLEYRINRNARRPDCIYQGYDEAEHKYSGRSKTADYFEMLYGTDPFEIGSSNTIFNCWTFLSRFLKGMSQERWDREEYALDNLDEIFDGYEEIRSKLDKLADYQYCLANLMPAPVGFTGSRYHDGKGNFYRDNDMPDIYFKRAEKDFPQMYQWINENMDALSLQVFEEYESYSEDGYANEPVTDDPVELLSFEYSVDNAISCIEYRSMKLINRMHKGIIPEYIDEIKRKRGLSLITI
ncbi:MAG: hypothetical protein K6E88_08625 [Lachnospiraceae bacterium]|nr:hypothetical protein [Lachnospiraceae bacterium]